MNDQDRDLPFDSANDDKKKGVAVRKWDWPKPMVPSFGTIFLGVAVIGGLCIAIAIIAYNVLMSLDI